MRRLWRWTWPALLALVVGTAGAWAAVYSEKLAVTPTSQLVTFAGPVRDVSISNRGPFDAFVKIFTYCETPGAISAQVGGGVFRVPAEDAIGFTFNEKTECGVGNGYQALARIAVAGEGGDLEVIAK